MKEFRAKLNKADPQRFLDLMKILCSYERKKKPKRFCILWPSLDRMLR